jgi:Protein of unknown function (DUF4232)
VVPILAAAVVLVALGLTAGSRLLRSDAPDRIPPAVSPTSTSPTPSASTTSPTPSTATSASATSPTPSTPATASTEPTGTAAATPSHSPAPSSTVPQNWYQGLNVAALTHTPGLCPQPGLRVGLDAYIPAPRAVSMPGETAPLWLVPVTCEGLTDGSHPSPVEVFRYTPDGPRLVQTLAYEPGDQRSITVTTINVGSGSVTLAEHGYDVRRDALCCRSLRFSQTYTWHSGADAHFIAGPQVDTLQACTGDQLTVTSTPLTGKSGDSHGILLTYDNNGKHPCTLTGYPGAAILDAAGYTLADAVRTPAGILGGYSSDGRAPRVVLYARNGSAVIEWTAGQHGGSRCYSEVTLLSTPPGTTATRSYGMQPRVCGLQVHPVVADGSGKG